MNLIDDYLDEIWPDADSTPMRVFAIAMMPMIFLVMIVLPTSLIGVLYAMPFFLVFAGVFWVTESWLISVIVTGLIAGGIWVVAERRKG